MKLRKVCPVGQRLLYQATQAPKVAFKAAKFQPGFLMLKAGHGEAKANPLAEGRK